MNKNYLCYICMTKALCNLGRKVCDSWLGKALTSHLNAMQCNDALTKIIPTLPAWHFDNQFKFEETIFGSGIRFFMRHMYIIDYFL